MTAAHEDPEGPEHEALAALERSDRKAALRILMNAYGRSLYRYCRQLVVDADLADDAHQTTFVQAYEGLGSFARRSSLRTWLFSIARHRCLDALKTTRRRQRRFQLVEELPEAAVAGPGADERLAARGLARALERCLEELTPRIRSAVLLRYREGFSYPQIARATDERPATLQARVARALPVLRSCLEGRGLAL